MAPTRGDAALKFSRRVAIVVGILYPLLQVHSRLLQVGEEGYSRAAWLDLIDLGTWPFWLDDFLLGGFLLYAAWRARRDADNPGLFLAGAWGLTCGLFYASFFATLAQIHANPYGPSSQRVAVTKGLALALACVALIATLIGSRITGRALVSDIPKS